MADQKRTKTEKQCWKMQDLENDGSGYIKAGLMTTLFESKQRVELKRAGVESSLVVDIKRKKAVALKNVHGVLVSTELPIKAQASPRCD